jgi:hypothetical protein
VFPSEHTAEREKSAFLNALNAQEGWAIDALGGACLVTFRLSPQAGRSTDAIVRSDLADNAAALEAKLGLSVFDYRVVLRGRPVDAADGGGQQETEVPATKAPPSNEPEPKSNIRFALDDGSTFGPGSDEGASDDAGLPWLRVPLATDPWLVVKRVVGDPVLDRSDEGLRFTGSAYRGSVEDIIGAVGGLVTDRFTPDVAALLSGDLFVLRGLPPKGTGRIAACFEACKDTLVAMKHMTPSPPHC